MTGAASPVVVETPEPGVALASLARPERRNAVDTAMVEALEGAVDAARDAAVLIVAGTEPGAFCAGADLRIPDAERRAVSDRLYGLYERLLDLRAVVIAAIDGPAIGAGAQLAVAADLRIGSPRAMLRFAGPGHGLVVGGWGLPSLVGRGRALDLCLSMRDLAAEEAHAIGLLDRLADEPRAAAMELARQLARLDRSVAVRAKRAVIDVAGLRAALAAERDGNRPWTGHIERRGGAAR